jgi:sulfur relay (sulfurtransferase) complex TusBCD TusD component (DsrE family)
MGSIVNKKKLGLMLSTPPEHPNMNTAMRLSMAALSLGHEVYLYLIDEGTRNLSDVRLRGLQDQGLKLFVCAYGAQRQGIAPNDQAVFCGLVVLSDLVKGCDQFISLN